MSRGMVVDHRITVSLGAMAEPLCKQLGVEPDVVATHQADADAITRLAVRGLLPERDVMAARKRLVKRLGQDAALWSRRPSEGREG